jgi:hypothetical protein
MSMRETGIPVSVETIESRIRAIPEYVKRFAPALPGQSVDLECINDARLDANAKLPVLA